MSEPAEPVRPSRDVPAASIENVLSGAPEPRQPLTASARVAVGHEVVGPVAGDEPLDVTVVLRRRAPLQTQVTVGMIMDHAELVQTHGAAPEDVGIVTAVLRGHGLDVVATDLPSRRMQVRGPLSAFHSAFGVQLQRVRAPGASKDSGTFRQRTGALSVPVQLADIVVAVLGLDDRPQASPRLRTVPAADVRVSYTPLQLGAAYDFPAGTDGSGHTLAIIELGGGFAEEDLSTYFSGLGIAGPDVSSVGVDKADNAPEGDPSGADGEVLLDIEVAGALAPGVGIVVYFAPNTDRGFLDAVATAVHATPTPTALSISWGGPESTWTVQARQAMDDAFADAAALGVTVTAAAGDNGSGDGVNDGRAHVDYPSSSPFVLACGGTELHLRRGEVVSEVVWSAPGHGATGGGVSTSYAVPEWQVAADVAAAVGSRGEQGGHMATTGRGVPDVSAVADPATGYEVLVDGERQVIGGTSAVSPLWAALVCRLAQALDRPLGLLAPQLYAHPEWLRDITVGTNGAYTARTGWDACTGLGVPVGTRLLAGLREAMAPGATEQRGA